jgi:hypothetical membrane protein
MVFGYDNRITAGVLFLIGGVQFTIFLIVAEAVYPGYSVSANYISDLGVWGEPSAAIFNPSCFLFGLLVLASAFFIQREFKISVFSIAVALSGLGAMGVGLFPENTFLVNEVPILHTLSAAVGFIFGGIAAILSSKITKAPFRYFSVILGAATLLALILFRTTESYDYLGLGAGGLERMIVYPTIVWTICFGGYLMASLERK